VLRVATAEDDARARKNRDREKDAMRICQEKIRKHGLEMKLIDAEYTFDNNKVLFYFTADGRIDFRELVKDLAAVFKMRIELRQIGVRDETKILGGIGICGRPLCCHSYLSEFAPVSIKMAKEQNLSLNPTKISGVCGRLMCCLKNEEDTYEYLNSRLPVLGDTVTTLDGRKGEVSSVNVLRQKVRVLFDTDGEKALEEFPVEELKFKPRRRKEKGEKGGKHDKGGKNRKDAFKGETETDSQMDQALQELEELEHKDSQQKAGENRAPRDRAKSNDNRAPREKSKERKAKKAKPDGMGPKESKEPKPDGAEPKEREAKPSDN
jgi:cell fate regulator YaaT (PSP1 superfamily)